MATFEVYTDRGGEIRWRLKADNGEKVLASEGYTKRASALNGIESVRAHAAADANYERKQTGSGWSFNLRATNGQVIGTSEVYSSGAARDGGIEVVKRIAGGAGVVG